VFKSLFFLLLCSIPAIAQQNNVDLPRPRMIRLSTGVLGTMVEHRALPDYPLQALQAKTQGDVILKILVSESGKVTLAVPVQGDPLLTAASIDALHTFQFRPYLLNGMPISVESQVGFHFSIQGRGKNAEGKVDYPSSIAYRPEFRTSAATDQGVLVLWPRKISGDDPKLPPALVGKAGSVYLTIAIGEDGKVQEVKVLGGEAAFFDAVVAAAKQFIYEPQLLNGSPSAVTTQVSFHFGSAQ